MSVFLVLAYGGVTLTINCNYLQQIHSLGSKCLGWTRRRVRTPTGLCSGSTRCERRGMTRLTSVSPKTESGMRLPQLLLSPFSKVRDTYIVYMAHVLFGLFDPSKFEINTVFRSGTSGRFKLQIG